MPSHESKTKQNFLCYVHFTSLNQGILLFFCCCCFVFALIERQVLFPNWTSAIEISGICTALLLSQKEQRGRKIGGNRNKCEPTSGKCQGDW